MQLLYFELAEISEEGERSAGKALRTNCLPCHRQVWCNVSSTAARHQYLSPVIQQQHHLY